MDPNTVPALSEPSLAQRRLTLGAVGFLALTLPFHIAAFVEHRRMPGFSDGGAGRDAVLFGGGAAAATLLAAGWAYAARGKRGMRPLLWLALVGAAVVVSAIPLPVSWNRNDTRLDALAPLTSAAEYGRVERQPFRTIPWRDADPIHRPDRYPLVGFVALMWIGLGAVVFRRGFGWSGAGGRLAAAAFGGTIVVFALLDARNAGSRDAPWQDVSVLIGILARGSCAALGAMLATELSDVAARRTARMAAVLWVVGWIFQAHGTLSARYSFNSDRVTLALHMCALISALGLLAWSAAFAPLREEQV